mmetsp:Transcript_28731/g.54426  ORF Transcript_28731/g.54426 Transcript_28731/m.54426 type:complete len:209 (-) Transcript_28731:641-1267(-)
MTTFCWLPPDSASMARDGSLGDRPSSAPIMAACSASTRGDSRFSNLRPMPSGFKNVFSRIVRLIATDSSVRSLATSPTPACSAFCGFDRSGTAPSSVTAPSNGTKPNSAREIASCPAPRKPTRPSTSFFCRSISTFCMPATSKLRSDKTTSPMASVALTVSRVLRPTIFCTNSSGVVWAMLRTPTMAPSRSTATRSAIWKISSNRCET